MGEGWWRQVWAAMSAKVRSPSLPQAAMERWSLPGGAQSALSEGGKPARATAMVQAGSGWGSRRGRGGARDGRSPRWPLPIPAAGWQAREPIQEAGRGALTSTSSTATLSSEGSSVPEAHRRHPLPSLRAPVQPLPPLKLRPTPFHVQLFPGPWLPGCGLLGGRLQVLLSPPAGKGQGHFPSRCTLHMPFSGIKATTASGLAAEPALPGSAETMPHPCPSPSEDCQAGAHPTDLGPGSQSAHIKSLDNIFTLIKTHS